MSKLTALSWRPWSFSFEASAVLQALGTFADIEGFLRFNYSPFWWQRISTCLRQIAVDC